MLESHSYISINSCLVDFLLKFNDNIVTCDDWEEYYASDEYDNNILTLKNTDRIKEIVDHAIGKSKNNDINCVPLFLKMWSDDFDPNRSVKANRQSIWMKTITIFAFTTDGRIIEHTYPIGLSKKGYDHDEMDVCILKEINHIKDAKPMVTMYSNGYKSVVSVYVDFFCVMNDQPERRKNLGLALGNSTLHKRMGYIMDYKQLVNEIRSCNLCTNSILDEYSSIVMGTKPKISYRWRQKKCKKCSSWFYNLDEKLLSYKPDSSYPKWLVPKSGMIPPKIITRDHIEDGIEMMHDGLKFKKCKKNEACNVLRYFGLSGDSIDNVVTNGLNARLLRDALLNQRVNREEFAKYKDDYSDNPSKYEKWKLPSSWFGEDHVRLYADVPMHLIFLGITKSVMIKATKWLTCKRNFSTFLSYTKTILELIEKMDLDWCKLMKYPSTDKFGGWVSENYLGMARACSWFYSLIVYLPEQEPYEDPHPTLPLKEWSKLQLKGWLEARDIDSTGKISELVEVIQEYQDEGINPTIVYNTTIWQKDILQMFSVLNKMISFRMSMETTRTDIDKLEVIIRTFLIIYDKVDVGMMDNKDEPSFMRQYNFLCLLNVPNNMRRFGCMRYIWEGGMVGESYL